MKIIKKWAFAIALAILLIAGCLFWILYVGKEDQLQFRTAVVRKGNIKATVSSTGMLMPLNTIEVGSQVSGIIKTIFVEDNAIVKKDQILAKIDDALYADQVVQARAQVKMAKTAHKESKVAVESAKASLKSAQAQLFAAKATFEDAKRNHDRLSRLYQQKIIADSALDAAVARKGNAQGSLDMAHAHLEAAKAQLEGAFLNEKYAKVQITERQANLSLTQTRLRWCTIQSPIDGIVIQQNAEQGQTVAAAFQAPVLFIIAQNLTHMKVEIDVSEADIGQIKPEQIVEFTVDAFPDYTFSAMVSQVKNSATNIHNVVTYKVIAETDNARRMLRPGMTANASILLATVNNTLLVPNAALRFTPRASDLPVKKLDSKQRYAALYKKIVTGLELNSQQARVLKESMGTTARQLKKMTAFSETDPGKKTMEQYFFTQIFTALRPVLNTGQLLKLKQFRDHILELEKKGYQQATVYVQTQGSLKPVRAVIGISDESFTQIVRGDLNPGDLIVIGNVHKNSNSDKSQGKGLFRFKG